VTSRPNVLSAELATSNFSPYLERNAPELSSSIERIAIGGYAYDLATTGVEPTTGRAHARSL